MLDLETYVINLVQGGDPHRRRAAQPARGAIVTASTTELDSVRTVEVARASSRRTPGVVALDGADVTVPGGSIVGLLGKNGAGKSTLIKCLAGVVAAGRGRDPRRRRADRDLHSPARRDGARLRLRAPGAGGRPEPLGRRERRCSASATRDRAAAWSAARAARAGARQVLDRLERRHRPERAARARLSVAERRLVMIARGLAAERAAVRARRADRLADRGRDRPPPRGARAPARGGRGDRLRHPPPGGDLRDHRPRRRSCGTARRCSRRRPRASTGRG